MEHGKVSKAFDWVIKYLIAMPEGTHIKVKDVPVNDKKLLVELVKAYIDCYNDVEFNANYTTIYKIGTINIKITQDYELRTNFREQKADHY